MNIFASAKAKTTKARIIQVVKRLIRQKDIAFNLVIITNIRPRVYLQMVRR